MPDRFDWNHADDPQDVVHQIVQHLYEGRVVLVPTLATYALVAYAERPEALDRLAKVHPSDRWSPVLALYNPESCFEYAEGIGTRGRRLIERALPGPLTLVVTPAADPDLLSPEARRLVIHDQKLSIRVPSHEAILETLRLLPEPLVLLDGPESAGNLDEAERIFGSAADIVVDAGPSLFGKQTTVTRIAGDDIELLREGVITTNRLNRLAGEMITFVCTGNTCRSPMAEAIFRKMLADHLGCAPDQLPERGFIVQSAGLSAYDGGAATDAAQEVAEEYGSSLVDHASQSLTPQMVQFSDRLIVMTRDHRAAIVHAWPEAAAKTTTLAGGQDVEDPVGGSIDLYRRTAGQISTHLNHLLADIKMKRSDAGRLK